jgi:hypothetical protein
LFSEVADANSTFKAIGGEEGENTAITGELMSVAVNVIVRIIYDSRRVGRGITVIFFKNYANFLKNSKKRAY